MASSISVSTIWDSGTVAITLPRTTIWPFHALQSGGHLLGQLVHVDLSPAAGRAGDDLEPALAHAERFQDRDADLDLFHRGRGQRYPDRVADTLGQQGAERDRGLDRALERRAGLGHAEVQRVITLPG